MQRQVLYGGVEKHLLQYSKADGYFLTAGHITTCRFLQADDLVIYLPTTSRMAKGKIIIIYISPILSQRRLRIFGALKYYIGES